MITNFHGNFLNSLMSRITTSYEVIITGYLQAGLGLGLGLGLEFEFGFGFGFGFGLG